MRYKNVLFFSMEDLNDWIGPLKGHPDCHTPNLDRFATNARVFERAYTEAPACSPSRTAMLFSTHPWTSGILHNDLNWYDFFQHGKSQSLISQFKQNGFETLGWGKVFHSRFERHSLDLTDWDRFTFQDGDEFPLSSKVAKAKHFRKRSDFGVDPTGKPTSDDLNAQSFIDTVKPQDEGKFWGFGTFRPHLPFFARQEFFDKIPQDVALPKGLRSETFDPTDRSVLKGLPASARKMALQFSQNGIDLADCGEYNDFLRSYLACIAYADHIFGKIIDHLEACGLIESTLIVFYSDHGWQLGEKLAFRKFTLWERALRVPLMIAGAGIEAGPSKTPVSLTDLGPTLLSLMNIPTPASFSGVDLSKHLTQNQPIDREFIASLWGTDFETNNPKIAYSLRSRRYRITRYWDETYELYDHKYDPFEHKNLANKPQKPVFQRHKEAIDAFYKDAESKRPNTQVSEYSKALRAKVKG